MSVLVDTSVWIEYFRSKNNFGLLDFLIEYQFKCLKNGLNGVGIPDLILAQNAKQNHCEIYSLDNHFKWLKNIINIRLTE